MINMTVKRVRIRISKSAIAQSNGNSGMVKDWLYILIKSQSKDKGDQLGSEEENASPHD